MAINFSKIGGKRMSEFDKKSGNSVADGIEVNVSGLSLAGTIGKPIGSPIPLYLVKILADAGICRWDK